MAEGVVRAPGRRTSPSSELDGRPGVPTGPSFSASSKTAAVRADQLPSTHPIAADIVDLEAVSTNFDQITYGKGASVLAQLVAFVGRDAFLAGVRAYFAEHAFGNTSLADLLAALEPPSGRDLYGVVRALAGDRRRQHPALEVETDADDVSPPPRSCQTAAAEHPTLRPHRLAVGLVRAGTTGGSAAPAAIELDVDGERTEVPELVGRPRPALLLPNDGDLTFAKVRLDPSARRRRRSSTCRSSPTRSPARWCWARCGTPAATPSCRPATTSTWCCGRPRSRPSRPQLRNVLAQASLAANSYTGLAERAEVQAGWSRGSASCSAARRAGLGRPAGVRPRRSRRPPTPAGAPTPWRAGSRTATCPRASSIDRDLRWLLVGQLARLGPDRRGRHRRRAGSATTPTPAPSWRPAPGRRDPTAEAKAEAWRLAVRDRRGHQRAQSRDLRLASGSAARTTCSRPYVEPLPRDGRGRLGAARRLGDQGRRAAHHARCATSSRCRPTARRSSARLDDWLASVDLSASVRRIVVERRADSLRALRCQQAALAERAAGGAFGRGGAGAWRPPSRSTARRCSRFLRRFAVPGVEAHDEVDGAARADPHAAAGARPGGRPADLGRPALALACAGDPADEADAVARVRALVDADAPVDRRRRRAPGVDPHLADDVASSPGLRLPGCDRPGRGRGPGAGQPADLDGGRRPLLGQADRDATGTQVVVPGPAPWSRLFPTVGALAEADPAALPMPRARGRALVGLAAALASGALVLDRRTALGRAAARAAGAAGDRSLDGGRDRAARARSARHPARHRPRGPAPARGARGHRPDGVGAVPQLRHRAPLAARTSDDRGSASLVAGVGVQRRRLAGGLPELGDPVRRARRRCRRPRTRSASWRRPARTPGRAAPVGPPVR